MTYVCCMTSYRNYGPTIRVADKASEMGLTQVLWLYGPEHMVGCHC